MRLDKFLKVSRVIKRRAIAKEVADQGRVQINDRIAKSSSSVSEGDVLTIRYGNKTLQLNVIKITNSTKKEDATSMYEIIDETYHKEDKS